jgi:uncharacterized protein (DUF1778 family)
MATTRPAKSKSKPQVVEGRQARLEARITKSEKALIERAAAYEGRTVSDFVVTALSAAAATVIHEHEVVRLNQVQSRAFVEKLLKAPTPNAALRRAARKYHQSVQTR